MPKRGSVSAKKVVPALEDGAVSKKRISPSDGDFVDDVDVKEALQSSGCEGTEGKSKSPARKRNKKEEDEGNCRFLGEPVHGNEAQKRWPHRYQGKKSEFVQAKCHFVQAEVDGYVYNLEDDAYAKADEGQENFICKIIEFFEAVDGTLNFTAQWYYRAADTVKHFEHCNLQLLNQAIDHLSLILHVFTYQPNRKNATWVIKTCGDLINKKQIFFSEIKDDNPLDCLVRKLKIVYLPIKDEFNLKENRISTFDFYYNRMYLLPYASFVNMPSDGAANSSDSGSTIYNDSDILEPQESNYEKTLLDLYSGCGAMSTGLCLGANSCGVKLVTKWAVDINQYACESLELNHPETQVRNEPAEDFLQLLIEWEKICETFSVSKNNSASSDHEKLDDNVDGDANDTEDDEDDGEESEIYEVEEILTVCYGDPNESGNPGLHFKIRWKGHGPEEDTWEPLDGLSGCQDKLKDFVSRGYKSKILPLPGSVDVICGGPPCQGISGFNRFRNKEAPLEDPKNKQLVVYMDIVDHLKPKFVLMENVVDIVKFAGGFLGRYALGRLVSSGYQARMGMMAAGAYGLPQFRMRMFMWGALSSERLPQYPLPTHNVVVRGGVPTEFEMNTVAYDEGSKVNLKKELFLGDAISDLPPVENSEKRDEMPYLNEPQTEFQRFIRLRRDEMPGCLSVDSKSPAHSLYDHRPLCLNQDDYERVCHVPKRKGANFRDLPGVRVRADNKVEWDPAVERKKVSSGKPLVPDYAMSFVGGTSSKPFGRLWWDETVPTVVTRAEPHNHALLHPVQDRVLTIRENARLQGFPDYYQLVGPIKERYIQVGNAVAVPVAHVLGYSLAMALRGLSGNGPLLTLPEDYPQVKVDTTPSHPPLSCSNDGCVQ